VTPAPKRRWFRFPLQGMFIVVTAFCLWLGWQVSIVQRRSRAIESGEAVLAGIGTYELNPGCRKLPHAWRWLGATPYYFIELHPRMTPSDTARWKALFPEARVTINNSPSTQWTIKDGQWFLNSKAQ
jgi:hypothetical protein